MRKAYCAVGALLLAIASASTVHAHAPTITLDAIGQLSFAEFPQLYEVWGTVAHNPVSVVQRLSLYVNGAIVASSSMPFIDGLGTTSPFLLPWEIPSPGTYALFVTARHGTGGQTGTSTEESVIVAQTVVVTECPAAPAIAASHLKELGVKPGSETYKEVMRAIAHETGNGGVLWGGDACAGWYKSAVEALVEELR